MFYSSIVTILEVESFDDKLLLINFYLTMDVKTLVFKV